MVQGTLLKVEKKLQLKVVKHSLNLLDIFKTLSIAIVGLLLVSSCQTTKEYYASPQEYNETQATSLPSWRSEVVAFAKQQLGDKYKYGAKGPNSFDCSGLVNYVYQEKGINISGPSKHLANQGNKINIEHAAPGDLIFFKKNGTIFHVSIISEVIGEKIWVVHSTTSRGVIEEEISSSTYWLPMLDKIISLK